MKRGKEKKKEKTLLQMMRSRGTSPTYFRGLPCQTILRFPKREKRERERERERGESGIQTNKSVSDDCSKIPSNASTQLDWRLI